MPCGMAELLDSQPFYPKTAIGGLPRLHPMPAYEFVCVSTHVHICIHSISNISSDNQNIHENPEKD